MTDDIFDYFGGKSPRKVEPLGQDDLFDDLMPKPAPEEEVAESVDSAEPEVQEEVGVESTLAENLAEPTGNPVAESAGNLSDDSDFVEDDEDDFVGESHWDSLMESLGLEPATPVSSLGATIDDENEDEFEDSDIHANADFENESVEIIEDVEIVSAAPESDSVSEIFAVDEDDKSSPGESSGEVLSELFVPRDEDFDDGATAAALEPRDDDPFAAFHRESVVEEVSEDIGESVEEVEAASSLVVDDNFVEFEVRELDGGSDGKRGRRSRRRSEGGDRNKGGEDSGKRSGRGERSQRPERGERTERGERSGRGNRAERGQQRSERGEKAERGERTQSGGRGREQVESRGSDRHEDDRTKKKRRKRTGDDNREQSVAEVEDGGSDRQQRRGRKRRDRSEGDGQSAKKQNVPTWEDAICGVVDQNIKRHKSGSGRGGRRRRNH